MDDDSEHKKAKGTKECIIKRELMFRNKVYRNTWLGNTIKQIF